MNLKCSDKKGAFYPSRLNFNVHKIKTLKKTKKVKTRCFTKINEMCIKVRYNYDILCVFYIRAAIGVIINDNDDDDSAFRTFSVGRSSVVVVVCRG